MSLSSDGPDGWATASHGDIFPTVVEMSVVPVVYFVDAAASGPEVVDFGCHG